MENNCHHWRIVIFKSKHAVQQHEQLALTDGGAPGFPENCSAGLDSFDPRPIGYQGRKVHQTAFGMQTFFSAQQQQQYSQGSVLSMLSLALQFGS